MKSCEFNSGGLIGVTGLGSSWRRLVYFLISFSLLVLSPHSFASSVEEVRDLLLRSNSFKLVDKERIPLLLEAYEGAREIGYPKLIGVTLYQLCGYYLNVQDNENYDRYRELYEQFYKKHGDETTGAFLKFLDVDYYRRHGEHKEAIRVGEALLNELQDKVLANASRSNEIKYQVTLVDKARLLNYVGISHFTLGSYEVAHTYFYESLNYYAELDLPPLEASVLGNLSAVSWSQNDFEKALDYTEQAIEILKKSGDQKALLRNRFNRAIYLVELGREEEAMPIFYQVLEDPIIDSYPQVKVSASESLSEALIKDGRAEEAKYFLDEAMAVAVNMKNIASVNSIKEQLAKVKIAQGLYDEAKVILDDCLAYYESSGIKRGVSETYQIMSDLYKKLGDYKQALNYAEMYFELTLELQNQSRQRTVAEFREKFEAKQRDEEIRRLRDKNELSTIQVRSRNRLLAVLSICGALFIFLIWTQLRNKQKLAKQFENLSLTDPLTKIGNRRFFQVNIDSALSLTKRESQKGENHNLGIFIVDIDFFKRLNDNHGHDIGDRVLVEFAQRLKSTLRDSDILVRWGGEEFVVVARIAETEDIQVVASRILQTINESSFKVPSYDSLSVTCSIGGVLFPFVGGEDEEPGWQRLINLADYALYQAKENGRNQWVLAMNYEINTAEELNDSDDIAQLVERKKLSLCFSTGSNQPKSKLAQHS